MRKVLILLMILVAFSPSPAQILNGSFEKDSLPDLSGWQWTCFAESENDASPGGGDWCIRVFSGNTQGCWQGYAYQKLPDIYGNQAYYLTGWARTLTVQHVGLYFGTINKGTITLQEGDTTSSTGWKQLGVHSEFHLAEGDTAVVVLWGGLTGGPVQGYGFFDLINLQPITATDPNPVRASIRLIPNPASDRIRIISDSDLDGATIRILNLTGQTVEEQSGICGPSVTIDCTALPEGMYFLQIRQPKSSLQSFKLLINH
jgi:hypothetical protein